MTSAVVVTNVRTSTALETVIDLESAQPQDSGSREAAQVSFEMWDEALAFDLLPEDEITWSAVGAPTDILFGGLVRLLDTDVTTRGRKYRVTAYDYSTLLDRINVVEDDRPAGESDADRLAYFMTTYGAGLLDDDPAGIATLRASMPAQKFRLLTLRQAIEQVLGSALETGTYRINAYKKLETWDTGPGLATAPFNIVLANPGAGELAPEAIAIKGDSSELYNAYWVRGATAAGSGWFTDAPSIAQWGRREKYVDAPDSDLAWKAYNVGHAALADTAQPKYRGTMTVAEGDWRSEQRFLLTSPPHGLVAAPFDTARVGRRYLTPAGDEVFDVEFGSPKASFAAKHGKEARRADGVGPGSGGWGPGGGFGGGGEGSAQGNCGCPPFDPSFCIDFENFGGRIIASGWEHSTDGHTWDVYSPGTLHWSSSSVGSGVGVIVAATNTATNTNALYQKCASTGIDPWVEAAPVMTVHFILDDLPPADATFTTSLTIGFGSGDPAVAFGPAIGSVAVDEAGDLFIRFGTGSYTNVGPAASGVSYTAVFDFTAGQAKVFLTGGADPGWQASSTPISLTPGIELLVTTSYWGHQASSSDTITVEFEDITFNTPCVGESGREYVWTNVGTGNSIQTSFSALTPFSPGSLQVRVNSAVVTPLTQDPTTGAFDLPFPPSSIETVWAKWVVA